MKSKHHNLIVFVQYSVLIIVMFVFALLFQRTSENIDRFFVLSSLSVIYFFWGIWHHSFTERIDKLVVFEYSLVSFIVILLSALGLGIVRFF